MLDSKGSILELFLKLKLFLWKKEIEENIFKMQVGKLVYLWEKYVLGFISKQIVQWIVNQCFIGEQ